MVHPAMQFRSNKSRAIRVVVLGALSPLLVAVPLFITMAIGFLSDPLPSSSLLEDLGKAVLIAVLGSYLFGGPAAFLSALVLGWMTWTKGTITYLQTALVTLVCGLGVSIIWGLGIAVFVCGAGLVTAIVMRAVAGWFGLLPPSSLPQDVSAG
ncbi:MAG: hypothetical protein EKK41_02740 [Hyphomicrobiales bacterium]|nr:MAG: hypothetical protein EKK41_02740 [Hyphomicrobiales bacterium]